MADVVLVMDSVDAAAVYEDGKRVDCGHHMDVLERLVERLGATVEYADPVVDKHAPGWAGIAQTLEQVRAAQD